MSWSSASDHCKQIRHGSMLAEIISAEQQFVIDSFTKHRYVSIGLSLQF
jgi:hypothetical protein